MLSLCCALLEPHLVGWAGKTSLAARGVAWAWNSMWENLIAVGMWKRGEQGVSIKDFLSLLSQLCWKGLVQNSLWSCSAVCAHHRVLEDDSGCVQPALQKDNVCVAVPSEKNGFIVV